MSIVTHQGPTGMRVQECPDSETASADYAQRFRGPVGHWLLQVQERALLSMVDTLDGASVLEVGGGHGQLSRALLETGCELTVFTSPGAVGERVAELARQGRLKRACGDLQRIPYRDGEFDVVVSVRLLAHFRPVERLVAELCRVARRAVVVDYARPGGVQRLGPWLFAAKKALEGNTRRYACLSDQQVDGLFATCGFEPARRVGQFVWPMVLHRTIGRPGVSAALERIARMAGLHQRFGSPVLARYVRRSACGKEDGT